MEFNVGDKVMVVRKVEEEYGWSNTWNNSGMTPYVNNGTVYTISKIENFGIRFEEDRMYSWPKGSLQHCGEWTYPLRALAQKEQMIGRGL